MGAKKIDISIDNFLEWITSTGNLFPRNPVELNRFEKLYSDFKYHLSEECVDPFAIINGDFKPNSRIIQINSEAESENFRIAARNLDALPDHIKKKLKHNQNGQDSEDTGLSE